MKNFLWIVALIIVIALLNTFVGGMSGQALAALFLAILVFWGKGDGWIAGYNTASEEEKAKVNVKRLRFLFGSLLILSAGLTALHDIIGKVIFVTSILLLCVVSIILANTWAQKK